MKTARLVRGLAESGGWSEVRRPFPSWSLTIPASFDEIFSDKDGYWHGWDDSRSVSLTSMTITDKQGRPVSATAIHQQMGALLKGEPIDESPAGLIARATTGPAPRPARASRILQGLIATEGRVLLVTVTSDDMDWASEVWLSIRHHRPI